MNNYNKNYLNGIYMPEITSPELSVPTISDSLLGHPQVEIVHGASHYNVFIQNANNYTQMCNSSVNQSDSYHSHRSNVMSSNTSIFSMDSTLNNYMPSQIVDPYLQPYSTQQTFLMNSVSKAPLERVEIDVNQQKVDQVTKVLDYKQDVTFKCNEIGCTKSYSGISGLNNHIKKKHSGPSVYPCDECSETFKATHERTLHKIKEHEGRRYQASRNKSTFICSVPDCGKEFSKLVNLTKHEAQHSSKTQLEVRTHKCGACGEIFNHKSDLVRHTRNRHTGNGEYPCPECSKVFYTYDMFVEHRNLHDDSIPKYNCNECGKQFITQRKLKEHSIIHQERIMFKCEVCAKVFVRSQTLQYHRITCKAAYPCNRCVDSFMTAEGLAKHKSLHGSAPEVFTCQKCNKVFPSQQALTNHEKRHSLRMNYTCQICKETVSTRAKFQKHIKDHLETNLRCGVCNEEFQSLVKYGYHKAEMHSIMRPYDCLLCSDEFCTRHELFVHLHNHIDVNTSSDSFSCETCGMKFPVKITYQQHMRSHLKNKSDQETVIDKNQSEKICEDAILDKSSKIETISNSMISNDKGVTERNKKLFSCDSCDKIFSYKSLLQHHKTTEHEIKRYPCTIGFCDQIFDNQDDYETHKISHEDQAISFNAKSNFICTIEGCGRVFQFQRRLDKHMSSHQLKTFECDKCKKIYYSETVYNNHNRLCTTIAESVRIDDTDLASGPVKCHICKQLFENLRVLKFHRKFCPDSSDSLTVDVVNKIL